ncbi:alpha/beta hydrolase [Brevibacillus fulvus]|uniref:Acetyl esterase n=1 Tax=Brevibacillus fulvus TaxID=1125967 RepID=A0A938XW67_9BACL|nr:alpha/beta hydrolase [Brevibacillus fulvus]MBM7588808.1 acetyl esterase [Brevibacillus fulvus]
MTLDPQVAALLEYLRSVPQPRTLSPETARKAMEDRVRLQKKDPVGKIENRTIPGPAGEIPIRLYYPTQEQAQYPVLVFFHGGGWVLGSLNTHDDICCALTNRAHCLTISVDYRLAPEHKFPAAVEDAYAAVEWTYRHANQLQADPRRIAVGGDSAGGNLAAVVALLAKEKQTPPLVFQLLIYPSTSLKEDTVSKRQFAHGYLLTEESMLWFREQYLREQADQDNPLASPLLYEDFRGLPAAYVMTAEYDPLRDEGEAYAEKLRQAGVPVQCERFAGMTHGFVSMSSYVVKGKLALDKAGEVLQQAFYPA